MFVFLHLQIYKNNKHVILPDSFFLYFILKALWFCHNLLNFTHKFISIFG